MADTSAIVSSGCLENATTGASPHAASETKALTMFGITDAVGAADTTDQKKPEPDNASAVQAKMDNEKDGKISLEDVYKMLQKIRDDQIIQTAELEEANTTNMTVRNKKIRDDDDEDDDEQIKGNYWFWLNKYHRMSNYQLNKIFKYQLAKAMVLYSEWLEWDQ
jgi:hypothetical protein